MAESLLGGILGEEDEKAEVEAPSALAGAEAFAAAVAARLSASDPEVARNTSAFLKKQAQILETQNEHLKEEHAARLHFLQGQAREVDIRRFGLRLRVGFQLFIALLATAIGVALILMVHDAVTSRSVIVDPFETPAALEGTGTTGKVVAAGVLDELESACRQPPVLPQQSAIFPAPGATRSHCRCRKLECLSAKYHVRSNLALAMTCTLRARSLRPRLAA